MDDDLIFRAQRARNVQAFNSDQSLKSELLATQVKLDQYKYGYFFDWLGVPIIRTPDDIVSFQELMFDIRPDRVLEVGIARGGSVILTQSLLLLLGCNNPLIAVDIDIRKHNLERIKNHFVGEKIVMIEGDSVAEGTVNEIRAASSGQPFDLIILDGMHTEEHVLQELTIYSELLSENGYIYLPDTVIEFFPKGYYFDRPWDIGNNPWTAIQKFLAANSDFEVVQAFGQKLAISEAPGGLLRKLPR